jgi:hypothetical protein
MKLTPFCLIGRFDDFKKSWMLRYFPTSPHDVLHRRIVLLARRGHASTKPASLLAAVGVWPLAGAVGWPGQPNSSHADGQTPRVATQPGKGARCWPGSGQAQAQLAAARPRHHPRLPNG